VLLQEAGCRGLQEAAPHPLAGVTLQGCCARPKAMLLTETPVLKMSDSAPMMPAEEAPSM
jgi:hypothetical protein